MVISNRMSTWFDQPPGFQHPQYHNHVCHLHQSLYGLRQAPRARFSRLSSQLLNYGFTGNQNNISLLIYRQESTIIFVLIYVNDIILIGSSSKPINNVINYLRNDLGQLIFFLGVEASHAL
jgi:hypothetical protein